MDSPTTEDVFAGLQNVRLTMASKIRQLGIPVLDTDTLLSLANSIASSNLPTAEILVVGGGGGGGGSSSCFCSGGGGGGGVIYTPNYDIITGTSHQIVVGLGGDVDSNGQDSSFDYIIAVGGGAGASGLSGKSGKNGGSGGGGNLGLGNGGLSIPNQGNNGGMGSSGGDNQAAAGGGGGALTSGFNAPNNYTGGNGGIGFPSFISGSRSFYGAGGGGAGYEAVYYSVDHGGEGGIVGGGRGGSNHGGDITNAGSGLPNTGGGGGGACNLLGGSGGSGIVIIRYKTGLCSATGGTVTYDGDYTIHTFIASGLFVVS